MIYPTDGTVLIIAPSGIMKGVKHPNAAKLFMEYLLTPEASKIWVDALQRVDAARKSRRPAASSRPRT